MHRAARPLSEACHDAQRVMSVSFAYDCAERFTSALRFSFFAYFYAYPSSPGVHL